MQSVHAKSYPHARPTFYYTNGEPSGLAKDFVRFTLGSGGQQIRSKIPRRFMRAEFILFSAFGIGVVAGCDR
jgi:hypothetical protein